MRLEKIFLGLLGKAAIEFINAAGGNLAAQARFLLSAVGIFLFFGGDASNAFYRKNFYVGQRVRIRVLIIFICFLLMGMFGVVYYFAIGNGFYEDTLVTNSSFLVMGAAYIFIAFFILKRINEERENKNVERDSHGEPNLLSVLKKYGWSEKTIMLVGEPLYTLIIALLVASYNYYASILFAYCAISAFIYTLANLKTKQPAAVSERQTNIMQ